MKSPVPCSVLLVLSFLSSVSFAGEGQPPRVTPMVSAGESSISADMGMPPSSVSRFVIPGPQRSFLRMAGISQKVTPEEVLPLLSRNVFTEGYGAGNRPTEFLILLRRYVVQARELASLASQTGMVLRASNCADAAPLLHILGYRPRPNCGEPGTSLLTDDPERAFLAIDSGFPLPALERALQGGKPFEYAYSSESVPVIFAESDWTQLSLKNLKENSRDLLETLLYDQPVARLYWALSRMDVKTRVELVQSGGLGKLLPYAAVLDFYGRELCISNGTINIPGGQRATAAWKELVGADPASPASFVQKLIARDRGWLAAYFDVLSRTDFRRQEYFTDSHRLHLFYEGLRAPDRKSPATRGTFRPAPWLLLLCTQLQLDDSGAPLIPGTLEQWQDILFHEGDSGLVRDWARQHENVRDADELVKILFALSRAPSGQNALQMYMSISELDSRRPPEHRLSPETVGLLARKFADYSAQYRIFSEFPLIDDASIKLFLQTASALGSTLPPDRGNAFGIFQANIGIWQILVRQGQIPNAQVNESWLQTIKPFASIHTGGQLYDATRASLTELFRFATGKAVVSQDRLIDLLAGPLQTGATERQMHQESAARIRSVLDDQRLVSLDTLLIVGDALSAKTRGKEPQEYVVQLAAQTREFEMPRPIFTMGERDEWASGVYNNHHTDVQMKADLPKVLKSNGTSARQLEEARSHLASFVRDTLVGLNYAYYEPPGAQALHNNPLLVRSHDFAGDTVGGVKYLWQEPQLFGQGSPAGGGAHFVGSLASLPYALAGLEQDFLSPENVQALVWSEVTPGLLAGAAVPRWWNVSPAELHAIALYQRSGEELLKAAASDSALGDEVIAILSERLLWQQVKEIELALRSGDSTEIISQLMPADTFHLAVSFREKYPDKFGSFGGASHELQDLSQQHPDEVDLKRLSRDFGSPHPVMTGNYGLELLNVRPMPPFAGEASRLVAESWDSPVLYWARLADERGYAPVTLNYLVPELTRRLAEKIFATDFEDWHALQRAMRETGDDFRAGKVPLPITMSQSAMN